AIAPLEHDVEAADDPGQRPSSVREDQLQPREPVEDAGADERADAERGVVVYCTTWVIAKRRVRGVGVGCTGCRNTGTASSTAAVQYSSSASSPRFIPSTLVAATAPTAPSCVTANSSSRAARAASGR